VTEEGTVTVLELLERDTENPPVGAAGVIVTVQVAVPFTGFPQANAVNVLVTEDDDAAV